MECPRIVSTYKDSINRAHLVPLGIAVLALSVLLSTLGFFSVLRKVSKVHASLILGGGALISSALIILGRNQSEPKPFILQSYPPSPDGHTTTPVDDQARGRQTVLAAIARLQNQGNI